VEGVTIKPDGQGRLLVTFPLLRALAAQHVTSSQEHLEEGLSYVIYSHCYSNQNDGNPARNDTEPGG
jgi:hypothetical protein